MFALSSRIKKAGTVSHIKQLRFAVLLAVQLLPSLCWEMVLAQTAEFPIFEDTPLSRKTWYIGAIEASALHLIKFVFLIITYIASHSRWILNGKQGTKLCKKLTTSAAIAKANSTWLKKENTSHTPQTVTATQAVKATQVYSLPNCQHGPASRINQYADCTQCPVQWEVYIRWKEKR